MTWSLSNTITYVDTSTNATALAYLFDTFLPSYGWTTSSHPTSSSTKRSLFRSYTNQLTGNTLTNYHWVDFANSSTFTLYEDATYTSVPGDLGTDNTNVVVYTYNGGTFSTLDWKFWTSSEKANASMVTRGKYIIWFDFGVTDVFAYEDTNWNGSTDTGSTHFFPYHYSLDSPIFSNAPQLSGTNTSEGALRPSHRGTSFATPNVDSIIKGWELSYSDGVNNADLITLGVAQRITGNDIVLHVPGNGIQDNYFFTGPGVVVQAGSDYYFRFGSNISNVSPMVYMGTSEPDFT